MWNQKLKSLLNRFFDGDASTDMSDEFVEQTQTFQDPDATIAISDADVYAGNEDSLSMDTLRSMHFGLPITDTPQIQLDSNRYREMGKLGEGGMATVWKMKDSQLLRDVALKQLHANKTGSNYEQENFVVEAQITAQLQHPGIVPIHDLQIDESGRIYFTMREIQGQTLEEIIQSVHRVSDTRWKTTHSGWNLRRLIDALENICQTLAYAHSKGVIHQDLKPANIMVGDYGEILVVDWGVARVRSLYTDGSDWVQIKASNAFIEHKKTSVSGTPRYMAPEQIYDRPDRIDERADVFALGVILFYILTQDKPFLGSMKEIFEQKKHGSASIKEYISREPDVLAIPSELIEICERAMAYNPADRFKDAKEMQLAIQSWLDGARQEEEARLVLKEISLLQKNIQTLEMNCHSISPTLNTPSIHDMELSDAWWQQWQELQEHRQQMDSIRDSIYQKAQGAILYAPHLPEIYDQLIALEYQDYLEAVLEGNHKSISKTERRLNAYLQHLSDHEQSRWDNIRTVDLASLQSQKSHGVNIERLEEKSQILASLTEHSWINLVGLAGVGKTHLAWQISTQWCKDRNWDVIFCDVTEAKKPAGLLQRLTAAVGVQQTGADPFELVISILNRTHGKFTRPTESSILIIDNAESLNADSWDTLGSLIEQCPNIRIVSTTRKSSRHALEHTFTLHPMSLVNAIELFTQHCKQQLPSWSLTAANRNLVLQIVNTLDRIPLAIELAGARIAEFSLSEILSRLQERFSLLKSNNAEKPTLQMALSWSCTSLSDLEKQVLYQLSVIPKSFELRLAESVIDIPKRNSLSDILDVLTQHSLINREFKDGITSYTMLKSIRDYAFTQAESMLIQATHHRLASYLAKQIPFSTHQELDTTLLEVAAFNGATEDAVQCCIALLKHLKRFGPLITGMEIAKQFLERTDVSPEDQRPIQIINIDFLLDSGQTQAVLDALLSIGFVQPLLDIESSQDTENSDTFTLSFQTVDEATLPLDILHNQYQETIQRHDWTKAFDLVGAIYLATPSEEQNQWLSTCIHDFSSGGQLRSALGIGEFLCRKLVNAPQQLRSVLVDVAVLHTRLGHRDKAIEQYNRALDLAEQQKDTENQARIIGNLGLLHQADGNLEQALRQYLRAHNIFEQLQAPEKLSALSGNIGTIYHERGELNKATEYFNTAIELAVQCENHLNQGVFLGNRAMCWMDLNRLDEAKVDLEEAISICDRHLEFAAGAFRGELALVMLKQGQPSQAKKLLLKGEEQVQQHKEQYGKFLCRKAAVLYGLHEHDAAKVAIRLAEKLCSELNVRPTSALQKTLTETQKEIPAKVWLSKSEITERSFVAQLAFRWGNYESTNSRYPQALHHLNKALHMSEILGLTNEAADIRYKMAIISSHTGNIKEAISIVNELRHQYQISGNSIDYGKVTNFLGSCHRRLGDINKGLKYHEESINILRPINHVNLVSALENSSLCCRILGDYEKALSYIEQALEMALLNNLRTGTLYCNLGLCHNVMGEETKALECYHLGINELRKIGDRNRESIYLGNVANIYSNQGRLAEAAALYKEVIDIVVDIGVKANECIVRGNYGDLLIQLNNLSEATVQLSKSIELGLENYPIAANVFQGSLAKVKALEGDAKEARKLLADVDMELLQTDIEEHTKFLCLMTEIYHIIGDTDMANDRFSQASKQIASQAFDTETEVYQKWLKVGLLVNPTDDSPAK